MRIGRYAPVVEKRHNRINRIKLNPAEEGLWHEQHNKDDAEMKEEEQREVLESGKISSERFSIFWPNVSASVHILLVLPGAHLSAYFHIHRYYF